MNENCRPGINYLFQLHEEEQNQWFEALTLSAASPTATEEGMSGIPLPYQLRSDWMVTGVLFCCFLLLSYVLSYGKRHLKQQFKNFFYAKERSSLFDDPTASDIRHTLALIGQTAILSGFCVYDYFSDHDILLFHAVPHYLLLSIYIAFILVFFALKWASYSFINWIFFNNNKRSLWLKSYFNIVIGAGFSLFPLVLLIVYFDLSPLLASYFIGATLVIVKILLFYKCFSNFFHNIYGSFHLILYFCALEILPDLVLWKGIVIANDCLVLKF